MVVSVVYVAAMFMAALDSTVVNVALRAIGRDLQVLPSAVGIVSVSYLVSLAVMLPVAGWLGDRWGTKRILLLALAVFTAASALCGIASSLAALNAARILQGAAGGLLTPVGMAMLFRTFPPQERAKLSRMLVLPIALAPALGPIIGGFIVDQLSWRWVFYINLPVGVLVLLFGILLLREHREPAAGRLDWAGFVLSAPGLAMTVYALTQGAARGWATPGIIIPGVAGSLLLAALVVVELRNPQPLLDLRLLRDRLFRTMGLISICSAAGLLGMLYVFPLMYQHVMNASALDAGLTTFPEALGLMASSQLMPFSYRRLGPKKLISLALFIASVLFVMLSLTSAGTGPWIPRILLFLAGFALGHAVGAVQITSFTNIAPPQMGRASTLFTVQNRLGSALGMASLGTIMFMIGTSTVSASGMEQPNPEAYRIALLGAAAFLLLGLCAALSLRHGDGAAVLQKQTRVRNAESSPVPAAGK